MPELEPSPHLSEAQCADFVLALLSDAEQARALDMHAPVLHVRSDCDCILRRMLAPRPWRQSVFSRPW